MEDIRSVFFHELGHFVANEIDRLYLSGIGSKEILLYPCEANHSVFCGHTKRDLPDEIIAKRNPPPKGRLGQLLTASVYGCIFQAYAMSTDFRCCFDINGINDLEDWSSGLNIHKISYANKAVWECEKAYFDMLVENKMLDCFINLNPEDYMIQIENDHFMVDLRKLCTDTSAMIASHSAQYLAHIAQIQKIIDLTKPWESPH
jgi:hypothetical protein